MKFKIILFIYISSFLVSCNSNKTIIGKYRSNFAEMGFFVTKIELNRDNTFHYEFSGNRNINVEKKEFGNQEEKERTN